MRASRWLAMFLFTGLIFSAPGWSQDRELLDAVKQSKELQSQGNLEEALPFAEKALAIGKPGAADFHYKRALKTYEQTLGRNHPGVVRSLQLYASFLTEVGRGGEAKEYRSRAEEILEKKGK